jgi:hypothetical protein
MVRRLAEKTWVTQIVSGKQECIMMLESHQRQWRDQRVDVLTA